MSHAKGVHLVDASPIIEVAEYYGGWHGLACEIDCMIRCFTTQRQEEICVSPDQVFTLFQLRDAFWKQVA